MDVETNGGGRLPCNCSCPCCCPGSLPSSAWPRTLKRKLEKMEEARRGRPMDVARVEIEMEAAALREALGSQQHSIQELYSELEEERAAASTAASEAMSMILRLQREKAEVQMDARQFKRFAEERMSHDQQEIALLEDLLFKRDQAVQSLSCELQAYRHRLLSYGIEPTPTEPNSPAATAPTTPTAAITAGGDAYPPLRFELADFPENAPASTTDSDLKYAAGDTPRGSLQRLPSVMEKGVIGNGHSPRSAQRSLRQLSIDSYGSPSFRQDLGSNEFPAMADDASDTGGGGDDMSDRVYTVDAVHGVERMYDDYMSSPREFVGRRDVADGGVDDGEIKSLYMRLQALEADRESMRQAMMTMGTDKAQMVLLKEIAQLLCKQAVPERRVVKKPSFLRSFSVTFLLKWVTSFFFWRKKSSMIKYPFGLSSQGTGLLVLLEKPQGMRQKRCLTRAPR